MRQRVIRIDGTRKCPKCRQIKPLIEFSKDKTRPGGVHPYCLSCKARVMRKWRKKHRPTEEQKRKGNCRSYTHTCVKRGQLCKPDICADCGSRVILQAHHLDYSKPREVIWLCVQCHKTRHQETLFASHGTSRKWHASIL